MGITTAKRMNHAMFNVSGTIQISSIPKTANKRIPSMVMTEASIEYKEYAN
jgi:hypothetical protein